MIKVTVNVFSGRANPTWTLDEAEAQPVLKDIALHRGILSNHEAGFDGLGFRGIDIELLHDHHADGLGLPATFRIAHGASGFEAKAIEIADQLVGGMLGTSFAKAGATSPGATLLDAGLQQHLHQLLAFAHPVTTHTGHEAGIDPAVAGAALALQCPYEMGRFNPGFWNASPYISQNNCYNYASNHRTNTFAQPGRASGHQYTALTCPAVSAAAHADGLHSQGACFPDSERPRWYMALVMAPGYDYHWYRKSVEGFWGHKPGGTAARNTDNSGHLVVDPRTANRGPYTQFCGFFYACKSQRIR
jgi:hypothetical protein